MSLAPLLDAPLVIQLHAFAAMAAFALGAVQLAGMKGTTQHRGRGFVWVGLMLIVAVSSFWIHEIRLWGPWSPIHLLSILTLVSLPGALYYAHTHQVRRHRNAMLALFLGALVIAGIFTFVPGRIMHAVVFGG
ncbi:MAG: DUF2306 domain-containing protein [Hyphomicrobiaceae bacterium]